MRRSDRRSRTFRYRIRVVAELRPGVTRPTGTALPNARRCCCRTHPEPRQCAPSPPAGSVPDVQFSRELRDDVLAGDITLSVRLWKRPQVREGGRYRVGLGLVEVDAIELVPFAAITEADVRRAGEPDREALRDRAAHAGPIEEDTLVYRIELHAVSDEG